MLRPSIVVEKRDALWVTHNDEMFRRLSLHCIDKTHICSVKLRRRINPWALTDQTPGWRKGKEDISLAGGIRDFENGIVGCPEFLASCSLNQAPLALPELHKYDRSKVLLKLKYCLRGIC